VGRYYIPKVAAVACQPAAFTDPAKAPLPFVDVEEPATRQTPVNAALHQLVEPPEDRGTTKLQHQPAIEIEPQRRAGQLRMSHGWSGKPIMKLFVIYVLCLFAWGTARADEAGQCQANAGTYLTGTVTKGPTFAPGHPRDGVELSHTRLRLLSDQDGQSYDVAIDNVFATGYDAAGQSVPAPLSTIRAGDRLEVCGKLFAQGGPGIDWVHTNCGARPNDAQPDGWLKVLGPEGMPGPNLEDSQEYCRLWQ
jgi:hypothetical protein